MNNSHVKKHVGIRLRRGSGEHVGAWQPGRFALLCGIVLALLAPAAEAKPGPPVALTARIAETDSVARTARIEIVTRGLIEAGTVNVRCELPPGSVLVPGSGEWAKDDAGRHVLTLRVTLPPGGGKLVIKAELLGDKIKTGAVAGLALPPAEPGKVKAPEKDQAAQVIQTNTGEKLRLHR